MVTRETFVRLLDIARLLGDVFSARPKKAKPAPPPPVPSHAPPKLPLLSGTHRRQHSDAVHNPDDDKVSMEAKFECVSCRCYLLASCVYVYIPRAHFLSASRHLLLL